MSPSTKQSSTAHKKDNQLRRTTTDGDFDDISDKIKKRQSVISREKGTLRSPIEHMTTTTTAAPEDRTAPIRNRPIRGKMLFRFLAARSPRRSSLFWFAGLAAAEQAMATNHFYFFGWSLGRAAPRRGERLPFCSHFIKV